MTGPAPGASADLARRHAPHLVVAGQERPVEVDQTNVSVVVDEAVIVKWLVPPVPHPHPGVTVLEHLRAVGFDAVPRLEGVEVVDGQVVALVSRYVPGARDGWEWFVDDVAAAVADLTATAALAGADALGTLAGRLHVALATPSAVLPHPVGPVDVTPEWERGRGLLAEARRVVDGWPGEVLAGVAGRVAATLDAAPDLTVAGLRVHGDLHVGQVLRAGDRLVVVDFEGNPLLHHDHLAALRPAAVDVVSLVQSVDHACRVVERRRGAPPGALDDLAGLLRGRTLDAYRRTLARAGRADLLDDRLLAPLTVVQELHELVYAARQLPHWAEVAARTLRAVVPGSPTGPAEVP